MIKTGLKYAAAFRYNPKFATDTCLQDSMKKNNLQQCSMTLEHSRSILQNKSKQTYKLADAFSSSQKNVAVAMLVVRRITCFQLANL
jgi:copper oxidase (laccase) domain-containing protein